MRNKSFLLSSLVCLSIALSACGNYVSKEEYEKLEKRVEALENSNNSSNIAVEKPIDIENEEPIVTSTATPTENTKESNEWKTIEVTEGVPDSNEYDEFTLICSVDNIEDYLSLYPYDNIQMDDGKTFTFYCFVSDIFDKGWYFEEKSSDFRCTFTFMANREVESFLTDPFDDDVGGVLQGEPVNLTACKGKLRFISARHIVSDTIDDMKYKRFVVFPNGNEVRYDLNSNTINLKW